MRLVVNIPTYNEKDNIETCIANVLVQAKNLKGVDLQVLVSDSHSPDGTGEIVKKISKTNSRVHYLDVKERGLGIGIVKGHRYAIDKLNADILAQMDGDLSHDPATLPEMVSFIDKGYDLVNGSRMVKGGKNLLGWHRRMFTRGSALFCQLAWGTFNLTEYTNSYRVFTKELFQRIDFSRVPWKSQTYIIQPAFLHAAIGAGAKIKEVPITFQDRKKGYSKAKIVAYIIDVIKFGMRVRLEKSATFIKFLIVGTMSYFINAILLGLLFRGQIYSFQLLPGPILSFLPVGSAVPHLGPLTLDRLFIASVISTEISIIYNFFWHENWTFKSREHKGILLARLLKFNSSSAISPLIQIISIQIFFHVFYLNEQIGLAVGVIVGLFVNYTINMLWIWKAHPKTSK
ncbi:MAG: glycosyltransferase [Candidatus Curtissbacteria bacterium]